MTRFSITLDESVEIAIKALEFSIGGEIFIPKLKSYKILDLVKAISKNGKTYEIGIRPGEKIHEEMITASDSPFTVDLGDYYAIVSASGEIGAQEYANLKNGKLVEEGFVYESGSNQHFLSIKELENLVTSYVNEK